MNDNLAGFSVIVCTFQRHESLANLLQSMLNQALLPDEIIIVDGSEDDQTMNLIYGLNRANFVYERADKTNRGLTKQRNLGIQLSQKESDVLVFLDDDIVLEPSFFKELLKPFVDQDIIGVDGLIVNECYWVKGNGVSAHSLNIDGYTVNLSKRDRIRALFGLYPFEFKPGIIPPYGHGKSSLPPTGKTYEVEHIMGGITAYRKSVFDHIRFSEYFIGYGLYEDFDFSIRASAYGKLLTNTAARCTHHHAPSGRPNHYRYGRMVVTNGWYVWRLKHSRPSFVNRLKWYLITVLLILVRYGNAIGKSSRKQALGDATGRTVSLFILFFRKPQIQYT